MREWGGVSSPHDVFVVFVRKRLDTLGFCVRTPHTDSSTPVWTGMYLSTRNGPKALIRWQNDTMILNTEPPGQ